MTLTLLVSVFNGQGSEPYKEENPTDPINTYGQSKLEGEQAIQTIDCDHPIFLTCWVYDAHGKNFPNAILNRARTMETLKVVNDQQGTHTSANCVATTTRQALGCLNKGVESRGSNRIYHPQASGECSRYDFAQGMIDYAKTREALAVKELLAVADDEFPTKAARPLWSVLDNTKIKDHFGLSLEDWQHSAVACLAGKYS